MRALFVVTPGVGHIFPLIPLAWALRSAGHEVLLATTGSALVAADAGLPVVDVAPGFDMAAAFERMRAERRDLVKDLTVKITDLRAVIPQLSVWSSNLVDGVVQVAERWGPDVIVQSTLQGAGLVAAAKLGLPLVDHGFGLARGEGVFELLREHMADAFDRHGVAVLPDRVARIDVAPPSLLAGDPEGWSMRYLPYNGGGVLPPWLMEKPADCPRIAVTLGTVAPQTNGLGAVERIIDAAADIDAEFVVALGDADTSGLGELPSNVRVTGWIPLNALLRVSSALVHHGGAGSTLGALAAGVPQLVLPSGADRHINAEAAHNRGAGLVAEEDELDGPLLERLLGDEKLRRIAGEVSAEIAGLPSPAELVNKVAAFAA